MLILAGVLILSVMSAYATPKLKPLSGDVEHVTVNEIKTGRVRAERSVEDCNYPPTLHFTFRVQGEKITLNLEKNIYLSRSAPIFITNNGHSYREDTNNTNDYAVYQDLLRGSAMLVSCQDDGTFRLHGSFRHNDELYHMSHSNVLEPSPHHYVQRTPPTNKKFKNDGVMPPQEVIDELRMSGSSSRQRRDDPPIPGGNIVELLFTVDKAFYKEFKEGQGSDEAAKEAIQLYAALLANEMDLYYCSVDMADPSLSIKIYLAGVEIPEVGSDVSWSADSQDVSDGVTYINIDKVLPKLKSWLASESGLPQHDHLMALSTIELADFNYKPVETGVAGYAYVGTVCSSTGKVSISEVDGSRVALIASHELGHGLNANHDSGDCPNGAKNIMTTSFSSTTKVGYAEAQWTFSTCSVAAFKSFIDSLGSNCLKQHAFSGSEFAELQAKSLPGTVYSLDQQCQMYNGIWSSSCDTTLSESDCYDGFHCSTSSDLPAGCLTGFYPLYPFAGTPCGAPEDNKWCYRGRCVQKSTEATTTTSTTTSSTTSTTTSSTTSSTLSTTICTTSSTSTTPSTSTSTTSSTSPTTSTTPSTTSSTTTSPTTTSTTPSTTTTSTIPSTTTTSTTPSTTTTSTTPSTTTTSTTPSTTTSSTTPSTTTTSTTPSTTSTTTPTPCNKKKKCCVKVGKKKKCCKGTTCCKKSFTWAVETECYKSCCISTGTTAAPTPTPCYKKKCCTKQNKKKVCCKKADCCKKSWGKDTKCCLTCK